MTEGLQSNPGFEVSATLSDSSDSRTQLSSDYKTVWSEGDAFSVFNDGDHYQYAIKSGAGQTSAEFKWVPSETISGGIEGSISSEMFFAVYPYATTTTISKNGVDYVINTVIPTTQAFVDGSFATNAAPMIGVNNRAKFSMKNVASVLRMELDGDVIITKATLESKSHNIAGNVWAAVNEQGGYIPVVTSANANKITMNCNVQLTNEPTAFCFVLVPGTYEGGDLTVTFYDSFGNYFVRNISKENTFVRSDVKKFGTKTFEITGVGTGSDAANAALASGKTDVEVNLEGEEGEEGENGEKQIVIQLPATEEESTTLSFENIPDLPVIIEASIDANGEEAENVNLNVADETVSNILIIDLPNSSVNLDTKGQTTFEEVHTTTAANTLVVESGVTIKKLVIKGGNVRVKNGAKIETIEAVEGGIFYLFVENGAIVPATMPKNVVVVKNGSNIGDWETDGEF